MKIVVAVSGGIDSVVMLHMLYAAGEHELVVAHVDHGIRSDSSEDEELVRKYAQTYSLTYETVQLALGASASEEDAREKRYLWLRGVQQKYSAEAIATAHHQDDVIETMTINIIRGTGWRGLCSLSEHDETKRPLLAWSKADIIKYAIEQTLEWRDDSTNDDIKYLRNFVRYRYVQRLSVDQRKQWLELNAKQSSIREDMDAEAEALIDISRSDDQYSRQWFIMAGKSVVEELLPYIVGQRLERSVTSQIWHFICTAKSGKQFHVSGVAFRVTARHLIVSTSDIC